MATTTNFGWTTPDNTDLVKNGALAIRTLGSAIDTSLLDLKGGTTGQVLSKATNADLDFSWTTPASGFVGVSLTGSTQSITSNTQTALTFTTEDFDTNSFHDNSTNTSRITIPSGKGGKYQINALIGLDLNTTGTRSLSLYLNGSVAYEFNIHASATGPTGVMPVIKNLSVGDYIELFAWQTSGANRDFSKYQFSAYYLGA